jgi:hypothetical protein
VASLAEIEKLAFDLPDSERALLAARLLRSLPSILEDKDNEIAEAALRDTELEANPEMGLTLEQLDRLFNLRRADSN